MSNSDSLIDIIAVIWKWKNRILLTTILAGVIAIISSLMLPNYYRAVTTFYPASEDLAKPSPIGDLDRNLRYYGNDLELDRLLTIANSNDLRSKLIKEFDLYNHYQIDPVSKNAEQKITLQINKLLKVIKTKFDAIELSFEDQDPELAARLANSTRDKINDQAQATVKQSQLKLLETMGNKISKNEILHTSLSDSLTHLREKFNVYDLETQAQVLLEQVSIARSKNQTKLVRSLESQIENYNKGYSQVSALSAEHEKFSEQLGIDKEKYRQLKASYDSPFAALHIIEPAYIPVIKSRPKRSLYVIGAVIFSFLFCVFLALVLDATKQINWRTVLND